MNNIILWANGLGNVIIMNQLLTDTPNAKICDRESPKIIPTDADTEPSNATNPSLATSLIVVGDEYEYRNRAVARAALVAHTRIMRMMGLRGRVSLSVPRSLSCSSGGSSSIFVLSTLRVFDLDLSLAIGQRSFLVCLHRR